MKDAPSPETVTSVGSASVRESPAFSIAFRVTSMSKPLPPNPPDKLVPPPVVSNRRLEGSGFHRCRPARIGLDTQFLQNGPGNFHNRDPQHHLILLLDGQGV